MKLIPNCGRIVVKRDEAAKATPGGIVLPDNAKDKPKMGKVLSVGVGRLLDSGERATMTVKEGDRVLFGAYAGAEVEVEDQRYLILNEEDILGVLV